MIDRCVFVFGALLFAVACGTEAPLEEPASDIEQSIAAADAYYESGVRRIPISTGVTLAYYEQGARRGEPVIFVHGYTDSHHSFDRNFPILPRRYHVLALDLRGHGDSSKPACCYTQNDFAADVIAFMDAKGLVRASLVGHSMGSFIVQQVALDYPQRVQRAVLIGSAATVAGNPVAAELMSVVQTLEDPIPPEFVREFQASTFYRPIPESFLDTSVSESLKVPASVWKQALGGLIQEDHSARLNQFRPPALILYGEKDVFFTPDDVARLDALIPRSRLIVYPLTGHGTHVEVPLAVTRDIDRFLSVDR